MDKCERCNKCNTLRFENDKEERWIEGEFPCIECYEWAENQFIK